MTDLHEHGAKQMANPHTQANVPTPSKDMRRIVRYIRHDLKEILNPSCLPDPPGTPPRRRLKLREWMRVLREGTLDYVDSWRRVPIRPVHRVAEEERKREEEASEEGEIPWREILKDGRRDLRPVLQKIYYSRARVLSKTVAQFAEGFREGRREVEQRRPSRPE